MLEIEEHRSMLEIVEHCSVVGSARSRSFVEKEEIPTMMETWVQWWLASLVLARWT
jgi:hypothetical protein